MYFYSISGGDIDRAEIVDVIVYHEKKFSKEEFATIYNSALEKAKLLFTEDDVENVEFIIKILSDDYNFIKITPILSVWHDYLLYEKIDINKMMRDDTVFESE